MSEFVLAAVLTSSIFLAASLHLFRTCSKAVAINMKAFPTSVELEAKVSKAVVAWLLWNICSMYADDSKFYTVDDFIEVQDALDAVNTPLIPHAVALQKCSTVQNRRHA